MKRGKYDVVQFEVTQRCNLDCVYCYNVWKGDIPYPDGELDASSAVEMLDRVIRSTRCRFVALTGGEPLLRDDLEQIASFIHSKGVTVNIITNGLLLDEARTGELVSAGVQTFEIPVHSTDRDVHNRMTRSDSFDAQIEAAANVRSSTCVISRGKSSAWYS